MAAAPSRRFTLHSPLLTAYSRAAFDHILIELQLDKSLFKIRRETPRIPAEILCEPHSLEMSQASDFMIDSNPRSLAQPGGETVVRDTVDGVSLDGAVEFGPSPLVDYSLPPSEVFT